MHKYIKCQINNYLVLRIKSRNFTQEEVNFIQINITSHAFGLAFSHY